MAPVFLIGFMASGKSQVAPVLAQSLGVPCLDLDDAVERATGQSVAEIFESVGQEGFRKREREALELAAQTEQVVATGGGTACFGDNLAFMKSRGMVVHLATELATALGRVNDPSTRPLLALPPEEVEDLYRTRQPVYRRAHLSVSTEERTPTMVARAVSDAMAALAALPDASALSASVVALGPRSYPVIIEDGALQQLGVLLRARFPKVQTIAMVSDHNVAKLYWARVVATLQTADFTVIPAMIEPGEQSKCVEVFAETTESLIGGGLDRSSLVVALGGGVVGDLAGFVAGTIFRGVPVVQVPTTLLAMTDSAIGGKTGINSRHGKNLIGAFWQPSLVVADPEVLRSLPQRERQAAFGELVKYGLLDAALLPGIESLARTLTGEVMQPSDDLAKTVRGCAAVKAAIVSTDERERGLRATLNLGHTVAHAIEASAGYGSLLHGEAVALGLIAACRVSATLAGTSTNLEEQVTELLEQAGLQTDLKPWLTPSVLAHIGVDKKRTGKKVRFVTVTEPGDVRLHDLELSELTRLLLP